MLIATTLRPVAAPHGGGTSAADLCALEYALRLAEATGGRVVAVTVGGRDAEEALRDALAAGAHEALRVATEPAGDADPDEATTAQLLAAALAARHGRPDLVVCGVASPDRGTGATPAYLAAELGAAQALGLVALDAAGNGRELTALRRLDGGRRERLVVPLPAVCSVEAGDVRLRRATLPDLLTARRSDVPTVTASVQRDRRVTAGPPRPYRPRPRMVPLPAADDPRERVLALTGAQIGRAQPRLITPDTPAVAARELLDYLGEHGYLGEASR